MAPYKYSEVEAWLDNERRDKKGYYYFNNATLSVGRGDENILRI